MCFAGALFFFFFLMTRRPPRSTLFPYTTLLPISGDIFDGITPGAIPFARPDVSPEPARPELSLELGGPYSFYAEFRRAHGLTHLPHPEPPEIALQGHTTMAIPLWVRNRTAKTQEISFTATLAAGWAGPARTV